MNLLGTSLVPEPAPDEGSSTFRAVSPTTGESLDPAFHEATEATVNRAVHAAAAAFDEYRRTSPERRAVFLRAVADEISALGDLLISRASAETGLPEARLTGERGRTVGQLRLFADVVEESSWVGARIDTALPERTPVPRPDLRRMLVPLGPVGVFAASNFPLAFSVAGGDTASALAAGCPVVLKAHPAHPGTSELTARALLRAAEQTGMPKGVFTLLQGQSHEVGLSLVRHPLIRAIGFTGSLRGGRALYDAAAARPEPIPVYAEMGSVNPVFLLPSALRERADEIAQGLAGSITLGVGQFCTNPGVVVAARGPELDTFLKRLAERISAVPAGPMLYAGICSGYRQGVEALRANPAVEVVAEAADTDVGERLGRAAVFKTRATAFMEQPELRQEVFGPSSLVVVTEDPAETLEVARSLEGQLTATIHGTEEDLHSQRELVELLVQRAGRLIFNGYPTGVEVSHAMQHGGPYPATTAPSTTSVGTAAIERFARPVTYQDFPEAVLPVELRDANERGIWRMVNGELTRDPIRPRD
ncbi:MAG TPA: aldehyde dehydrogenase (NADP(+)) [Longimicrobiaceae bacterium]